MLVLIKILIYMEISIFLLTDETRMMIKEKKNVYEEYWKILNSTMKRIIFSFNYFFQRVKEIWETMSQLYWTAWWISEIACMFHGLNLFLS